MAINALKIKLRKQFYSNNLKRNKVLSNKFNKKVQDLFSEN